MLNARTKVVAAWLACLGALACQGALAQVSGAISLSHVAYVLTDLDPNDGIAPALSWTDASLTNSLSFGQQQAPWMLPGGTPNFQGVYADSEAIDHQIDGTSRLAQGAFQSLAETDGGQVSFAMPLGATVRADIQRTQSFTLTPNTLVSFSGGMQGSFSGSIPAWALDPNGYFDWATIAVSGVASMDLRSVGAVASKGSSSYAAIGDRSSTPGYATNQSKDTTLTVMMANSKATPMAGELAFHVNIDGYTVVPSVPEAATWAQMLLGGGWLCAWMHRRKRLIRP